MLRGQFVHAVAHVMGQDELDTLLLLRREQRSDRPPRPLGAFGAGDRRGFEGDVGEDVEDVGLLGVDHPLHLGELLAPEALLRQAVEEIPSRLGVAPQGSQFVLVLEERGDLAEEVG